MHENEVKVFDLNGTQIKNYDITFMLKNINNSKFTLLDLVVINNKRLAFVANNRIYILDILSKKLVKEIT